MKQTNSKCSVLLTRNDLRAVTSTAPCFLGALSVSNKGILQN